jgi:hypothetical protein
MWLPTYVGHLDDAAPSSEFKKRQKAARVAAEKAEKEVTHIADPDLQINN